MMRRWSVVPVLVVVLALGGCASNRDLVRFPGYQGPVVLARVSSLRLYLAGGRSIPVTEALRGYHPQRGFFALLYPTPEIDLRGVAQKELYRIYSSFDANHDGVIERPELTVLYIVEAARGLGYPVVSLGKPPIGALDTSPADIGGLVEFVRTHLSQMKPLEQRVFQGLEDAYMFWLNEDGPSPGGPQMQ